MGDTDRRAHIQQGRRSSMDVIGHKARACTPRASARRSQHGQHCPGTACVCFPLLNVRPTVGVAFRFARLRSIVRGGQVVLSGQAWDSVKEVLSLHPGAFKVPAIGALLSGAGATVLVALETPWMEEALAPVAQQRAVALNLWPLT